MVIDVAMTETARLADYVLPAASQYEKPEATFFNLEFPRNTFHLRHPLLEPLPGDAGGARDLGAARPRAGRGRRGAARAAARGRARGPPGLRAGVHGGGPGGPRDRALAPYVLYETLGPTLPDGLQGAAALWGLAQRCAMTYPDAVRRAGHADGDALFDAILDGRSGITFTRRRVRGRLRLHRARGPAHRARDPGAARRAARRWSTSSRAGPATSSRSSCPSGSGAPTRRTTSSATRRGASATPTARCASARGRRAPRPGDGGRARITTPAGSAEATVEVSGAMLAGHASLPNGYGLDHPDAPTSGRRAERAHVADWRDAFAGRPGTSTCPRGSSRSPRRRSGRRAARAAPAAVRA